MSTTTLARTARKPHLCENCHWTPSLRGVPTIAPGHRYLRHIAFPDGEVNTGTAPYSLNECVACAAARGEDLTVGACATFCCGEIPCARPFHHDGVHSCRRCAGLDRSPAVTR